MKRGRDEPAPLGEDEDEDSGSEAEEDEDDAMLDDLPVELLLEGDDCIEASTCVPAAEAGVQLEMASKALEKSRLLLFALHPEHKEMLEKALARGDDGKVPPGSALVQRCLADRRFLLCQVHLALAKVAAARALDPSNSTSIRLLRESLVFFPRCVESLHLLSQALRPLASTTSALAEVEQLLRKAVATKSSPPAAAAIAGTAAAAALPAREEDKIYKQKESKAAQAAQQALALLFLQSGRAAEASKHLVALRCSWRLSSEVLDYPPDTRPPDESDPSPLASADKYLQAFDGLMSDTAISHLKQVFRPDAPYWREHLYDLASNSSRIAGYVSYLYPRDRGPRCSVEQIIDSLFSVACARFPETAKCTVAEWWVHTRSHTSGHQLHFDSGERGVCACGMCSPVALTPSLPLPRSHPLSLLLPLFLYLFLAR